MGIAITICDDERAERDHLARLTERWADARGEGIALADYPGAESLLFALEGGAGMDILLLDIQMGGMDGVELARVLRGRGEAVQIIFITGYPDFMAEGYDVSALHYLMKPVSEGKLFEVLDRAAERLTAVPRYVLFPQRDGALRVKVGDIVYAEALSHDIRLCLAGGEERFPMRLSDAEALLGEGFFKCHRSYIVALRYVRRVTRNAMVMEDGTEIPLSRRLYDAANQAFIRYNV